MLDGLEGWHIVIIVAIAVVLFGSGKLPGAARSMGQSLRIFKSEMKAAVKDDGSAEASASASVSVPTSTVPTADQSDAAPQPIEAKVATEGLAAEPLVAQPVATEPVVGMVPQNVTPQQ